MREILKYGTAGGVGGNPGSYPETSPATSGGFRRYTKDKTFVVTQAGAGSFSSTLVD